MRGTDRSNGAAWRTSHALLAWLLVAAPPGYAASASDCLVGWHAAGGAAAAGGMRVVCRDGDPACDADGDADGACTFAVSLCLNEADAACAPGTLARIGVRGALAAPVANALAALARPVRGADVCTATTPLVVPLGRRAVRRLGLRAAARDAASQRVDRDRLRLVCTRVAPEAAVARVVVVTTDFETGVLAALNVVPPRSPGRLAPPIHADAVVRTAGGRAYVVNRFLGDNLQGLVPGRGFATTLQCTTGPRSNPHDVAVLEPRKAYVTRYGAPDLWVVDPGARSCDGFRRRTIDLGALADADGIPEMDQMALVAGRLFVSLARLDRGRRFAPPGGAASPSSIRRPTRCGRGRAQRAERLRRRRRAAGSRDGEARRGRAGTPTRSAMAASSASIPSRSRPRASSSPRTTSAGTSPTSCSSRPPRATRSCSTRR
jgi:hypothetical protein